MKNYLMFAALACVVLLVSSCGKVDYPVAMNYVEVQDESPIEIWTMDGQLDAAPGITSDEVFSEELGLPGSVLTLESETEANLTDATETTDLTYTQNGDDFNFTFDIFPEISFIGEGDEKAMNLFGSVSGIKSGENTLFSSGLTNESLTTLKAGLSVGDTLAFKSYTLRYED